MGSSAAEQAGRPRGRCAEERGTSGPTVGGSPTSLRPHRQPTVGQTAPRKNVVLEHRALYHHHPSNLERDGSGPEAPTSCCGAGKNWCMTGSLGSRPVSELSSAVGVRGLCVAELALCAAKQLTRPNDRCDGVLAVCAAAAPRSGVALTLLLSSESSSGERVGLAMSLRPLGSCLLLRASRKLISSDPPSLLSSPSGTRPRPL